MRETLPARREGCTITLHHTGTNGTRIELAATYGFNQRGLVKECFCLAFKTGTDLQDLLHQACIVISVALQNGATMKGVAHTLGEDDPAKPPRSIIGLLVRAGVKLDEEFAGAPA